MSAENLSDNDREQQQDTGEARVQLLITRTIERYERLLRRLAKE